MSFEAEAAFSEIARQAIVATSPSVSISMAILACCSCKLWMWLIVYSCPFRRTM